MNNSVAFNTFIILCSKQLYLFQIFSSCPKEISYPLSRCSPSPVPKSLWQSLICILSLWMYLFWLFHVDGVIQCVTFCAWLLSSSIMFLRFIHIVACTRFYVCLTSHCMYILQFVYPFIHWWTFGLFPPFGYCE